MHVLPLFQEETCEYNEKILDVYIPLTCLQS